MSVSELTFETFACNHHHKNGGASGGLLQANPFLPPFSRLHYITTGAASCENAAVKNGWLARSLPFPSFPRSLPPSQPLSPFMAKRLLTVVTRTAVVFCDPSSHWFGRWLRERARLSERVRLCSGHLPVKAAGGAWRENETDRPNDRPL